MSVYKLVTLGIVGCIYSSFASAAPCTTYPDGLKICSGKGAPYTVGLPDGRVLEIKKKTYPFVTTPMPFEVFENSCTHLSLQVVYHPVYQEDHLVAVWVKHPDVSKINQPVVRTVLGKNGPSLKVLWRFVFTRGEEQNLPTAARLAPREFLEIDDAFFNRDHIPVDSWLCETMSDNFETGKEENQIMSGMYDFSLERIGPNKFTLANTDQSFSLYPVAYNILIGQVVDWQFEKSPGVYCQISAHLDVAKWEQMTADYLDQNSGLLTDYLWGQDELTSKAEADDNFLEFGQKKNKVILK